MKTLQIEESTARKMYSKADSELKIILEESFGKDFFLKKITERMGSFKDVLQDALAWFESVKGTDKVKTKIQKAIYKALFDHLRGDEITADDKVRLVAFVLNEGWEEDYSYGNKQSKYYPYFIRTSSGGWSVYGYDRYGSYAFVGFGSSFKTPELATFAGKTFLDSVYKDFLPE